MTISRRKFLAGLLCVGPIGLPSYGRWVEPTWLKIRRLTLTRSTPTHRLVHFTDLHYKGDRAFLQEVVQAINGLKPDFVCFTGDLIEDAEYLPEALRFLAQIRAPLFGVPGNHDYWADIDFSPVAECFASTGGKWLMDDQVHTGNPQVQIIGVTCNQPLSARPAPGMKNILLLHYPAWVEKLSQGRFDLMLAGHSHGGQVRLPGFGPLLVPFGVGQFDMGLYQTGAGPLYVNPGIGYFFCNVRFCCRPEISLIEI